MATALPSAFLYVPSSFEPTVFLEFPVLGEPLQPDAKGIKPTSNAIKHILLPMLFCPPVGNYGITPDTSFRLTRR